MNNVVNLRETRRTSKLNINSQKINVNDIVLVYDEMVPRNFSRIAIVTEVLLSGDSEIRGAIVRIAKTNTILKCPVNKLFTVKNKYHDTNQIDKAREQKLRREAAVIGELNITNINLLIIFNKTREIFPSGIQVLSILLTTTATTASVERVNSKESYSLVVSDLR